MNEMEEKILLVNDIFLNRCNYLYCFLQRATRKDWLSQKTRHRSKFRRIKEDSASSAERDQQFRGTVSNSMVNSMLTESTF